MLYIGILAVFAALAVKVYRDGGGYKKKGEKNADMQGCFFRMAALLYGWLPHRKGRRTNTVRNLVQLHPGDTAGQLEWQYEVKRIRILLIIVLAGDVMALFLWIKGDDREQLVDECYVLRQERGGNSKEVFLTAKSEQGEEVSTCLVVEPRRYGEQELEALYEEMLQEVYRLALQGNDSWDCVTEDLYLMDKVEAYPFTLSWSSDNYAFVTGSGRVAAWEDVQDGEEQSALVTLELRAEYYDFVREHTFYARICPAPKESAFSQSIETALQEAEASAPQGDRVILPLTVEGENVVWAGQKENRSQRILLSSLVLSVAVWVLLDRKLQNQVQERNRQMEAAYPTVISKLTLYLSAGMNLKGAWAKIAQEGSESANPIYREMLLTFREMDGGIAEAEAYERFGKRVCRQRYIRLTTLLVQNLKKGNAALLCQLKQEALLALEDHAAEIKRMGEEMGTKLLFPMLLLMAMVMVLIMVPAFLSF